MHTANVSFVDTRYGVCCQWGAAAVGQIFLRIMWAGFLARELEGLIWTEYGRERERTASKLLPEEMGI